jgi:hypothetical protein
MRQSKQMARPQAKHCSHTSFESRDGTSTNSHCDIKLVARPMGIYHPAAASDAPARQMQMLQS